MKYKLLLISVSILLLTASAYSQSIDKGKLDQLFDRLAEKDKAMGTLVINKDGNTLYARSIGYAYIDSTEKKPLTNSTKFRIGSVTKMFTATMVYQLIEEG